MIAKSRGRSISFYLTMVIFVQAIVFSGLTIWAGIEDYHGELAHAVQHPPEVAREEITAATASLRETLAMGIGAMVVLFVVGAVMRRRITRPVQALADAVDEVSGGDTTARIPPAGPRELVNLAERFNNLLDVRARSEDALQQAYDAERRAADRLRELDGMKSSFLMAISHELRTPLTAVSGYAELLEDESSGLTVEERIDATHRLAAQARKLERLLVDLLDIERMSRGTIEAHRVDVSLRELVERVVEQTPRGSHVHVEVDPSVHARVDVGLMERVVENLVMNAIKHTPPGTTIWVRATQDGDEVVLMCEDDGPGIPEGSKEDIFQPFHQGAVPEHAPGTGIGLALVMRFAKLHGGHAWVTDRPGGGASFRVSLPTDGVVLFERDVETRLAS